MTEREPFHALYMNGIERNKAAAPRKSFPRLESQGVQMTYMEIKWQSLSFEDIFDDATESAEEAIRQYGRIALVGASAGFSLAVNVYQRLRQRKPSSKLSLVGLSGRTKIGDPEDPESRDLNSPGKEPSPAYIASVIQCEEIAVPGLSESDKEFMRTVRPLADPEVPLYVMGIDGVKDRVVKESEHLRGIVRGLLLVPELLDDIYSSVSRRG